MNVTITCALCGKQHDIDKSEYNWQIRHGRERFFCSRTCAAVYNNSKLKKPPIQKECEYCGRPFQCYTPYTTRFCSRSCASAGSITPKRLEGNKIGGIHSTLDHPVTAKSVQMILKKREAWKYVEIEKLLSAFNIAYEFEYLIADKYIFDIYIFLIGMYL